MVRQVAPCTMGLSTSSSASSASSASGPASAFGPAGSFAASERASSPASSAPRAPYGSGGATRKVHPLLPPLPPPVPRAGAGVAGCEAAGCEAASALCHAACTHALPGALPHSHSRARPLPGHAAPPALPVLLAAREKYAAALEGDAWWAATPRSQRAGRAALACAFFFLLLLINLGVVGCGASPAIRFLLDPASASASAFGLHLAPTPPGTPPFPQQRPLLFPSSAHQFQHEQQPSLQGLGIGQSDPSSSGTGATSVKAGGSTDEANIAFFLQVSESNAAFLPRLLRVTHHPDNVYAIHFDRKMAPATRRDAIARIRDVPAYRHNVHIMQSELVTYRGVSMLLNTISAMRFLTDAGAHWDYFINLSGTDYPLVDSVTLRRLLGSARGLLFFTFASRSSWSTMAENRLAELWFDDALTLTDDSQMKQQQQKQQLQQKEGGEQQQHLQQQHGSSWLGVNDGLTRLKQRNPLVDRRQFEISYAEAWMILPRYFCEYVLTHDTPRRLLLAFALGVDTSEHFFASLAWNSKQLRAAIVPHSFRLIIWRHEGVLSGQHPFWIDERVQKPGEGEAQQNGRQQVFKFQHVLEDSVLFFARKFGQPDSPLMDWIDNRTRDDAFVARVSSHFTAKVASRELRVAEM